MQGGAVGDGGHAEFAHAVIHIVAALLAADALGAAPQGQVGAGQVGRAAQQLGQRRAKASMAFCEALRVAMVSPLALIFSIAAAAWRPVGRQFAPHAALELGGFGREGGAVGGKAFQSMRLRARRRFGGRSRRWRCRPESRTGVRVQVGAVAAISASPSGAPCHRGRRLFWAPLPMMVVRQQISVGRASIWPWRRQRWRPARQSRPSMAGITLPAIGFQSV